MHILRAFFLLEVMFLPGVESICAIYAALPSAFGYLRSVGSLSGTHSTLHQAVIS